MAINKEQLEIFEKKLLWIQSELAKEIKNLDSQLDFGDDIDHLDEEADETEEIANTMGIKEDLKGRLATVEKAMEKMKSGGYGKCEKCGMEIETEILNIVPESEGCKMCKMSE